MQRTGMQFRTLATTLLLLCALAMGAWAGTELQATTLREAVRGHGMYIGAAFMMDVLHKDPRYNVTFSAQFNMAEAENECKWFMVQPQKGVFDFSHCDAAVKIAEERGMVYRGHNLCWYMGNPQWLQPGIFTPVELEAILRSHIVNAVTRYGDRMYAWDVVNEAIDDVTNKLRTNNVWAAVDDYIAKAFGTAREASKQVNSTVKLFYNDYNVEGLSAKSDAMYNLLKDLKAKSVPVDGVGLQMHISIDGAPSIMDIKKNMERLAALDLEIHITEMDLKGERLEKQASMYRDILKICLENPRCTAFQTWGFTDRYSWLYNEQFSKGCENKACEPLIFDREYNMKPAAKSMLDAMLGE